MSNRPTKRDQGRSGKDRRQADSLEVELKPSEKQAFCDAAELAGLKLADWVRERLLLMAEQELQESRRPRTTPSAKNGKRGKGAKSLPTKKGPRAKKQAPDFLVSARFLPPLTLRVTFGDGLKADIDLRQLETRIDRIQWDTAKAAGNVLAVRAIKGEPLEFEASTFRSLADPAYAAQLREQLKAVQLSQAQLQEFARILTPPDDFFDEPEDVRIESWK